MATVVVAVHFLIRRKCTDETQLESEQLIDTKGDEEEGEEDEDDSTAAAAEAPIFELPIANIDEVTGVQAFQDPSSSELHTGFDFKLPNPTEIFAPVSGEITDVHKFQMSNGLWIIDVNIEINAKWSTFIAFEPCTYDESVLDQQMTKIVVNKGDTVKQGQLLGVLDSVPHSEFPHIHWQVQRLDEPVSPYDYYSERAKAQVDILCDKFNTQPAY